MFCVTAPADLLSRLSEATVGVPEEFLRVGVAERGDSAVEVWPEGTGYRLSSIDGDRSERNLDDLATTINMLVVADLAARARELTLFHAGAVEWKGAALVFAGVSQSGKSRLVEAVLRAGAGYLSDEYAPVNDDLEVLAWPRALGLREHDRLGPGRHSVEDLGGRTAASRRYPISAAYLLQFDGSVRELDVRPVPPAEAVLRLLPHTFSARTPELLDRLGRFATSVPTYCGARGEADDVARALLR